MVMFVAGSSAWAESSVTYSFRGGAKTYGPDENGITISCSLLYEQGANIYGGSYITITSENPITRVELTDCSASGYGVGSGFGALIVEGSGKGKMTNNGESATWTTTGTETSVSFTTGNDFCVGRVEVFYEGEDDGSVKSTLNFAKTAWNLSVNGETAVPTSGCHFDTRDVFTNADGVTMTLNNVASRGEGGLNSERKGSGYAQSWPNECYYSQYVDGYFAMYFCNGEGFTITAPSGYTLNKIVVNRPSNNSQYPMTSLIMDGVTNTGTASGTWEGEAESVEFSTISGDATKRILVSNIQVTLMPIVDEGEVTYTIDLVDAPAGAYVTLDGQNFNESNNTYTVEKSFGKNDLEAYEPAGYYAEVEYTRDSHIYTVTYHAYNYYDVTVTGTTDPAAGVVYNEQTYGNGTRIETKDVLTQSSVEAADVAGYNVELTLTDGRFNVNYTEKPVQGVPWVVNVASIFNDCTVVDYNSDGKTWAKNGEEIYYPYHGSNYANDYIILPAVRLEAGKTYTVGVECHQNYSYTEKLEVLYGTTNNVAGMTNIAMPVKNVTWNNYAEVTNDFSVAADGVYYFAIHAVSNPDLFNLYVRNFSIKEPEPRQCVMDVASTYFSTGNVEQINSNLSFVADVNTEGEHSGAYGSSTEVPAGVTLEDGNGTSYTISSMLWWDNSSQVAINLASAITAPGHYTLTIPEGVIPCVGNKANKEIVFEWTILEPTRYTVTVTGDYTGENAGVRYNSNTYKDGDEIIVKGEIVESELTPVDVNGYDENVRIENQNIIVTYTTGANISYTVNVVNAPDGATVTLGNDEWTTNGEYTLNTPLTLDGNEIVASEPTGYYAVVNYENRVFTVTYYEYIYYSVVVKGISDPAAGVTYHGNNYGAGQQIEAREELTEGSVTASNVTDYEGHVSLVGNTFTVTYSVPSYVEFATTNISNTAGEYSNTKNGVTIVGVADTATKMLEIFSRQYLTVTSATLPIDRVGFVTGDGTLDVNADPAGAGVSGTTWSAGAGNTISSVTFKAPNGADNYISSVRVYLRVPQLITYNLAFAGEAPDGAKVTIEGQQYGAGEFETYNENFTTADIDATWPGYDAEVTYDEGTSTFTVTYYATTTYDVVVSPEGLEGAAVIYGENEYAAGIGVITCRGTIDEEALSAKGVYGYVGEVTVADNTITVTYTESEYYDVAESDITVIEGDMAGMTKFKIAAPAGKTFSEILAADPAGKNVTVNGEAKYSTIALGYEGSFITFTNPVMANQYGTFTVEFAAGLFETADGKKNNAFSYTYTVEDPAAFTEPYFVNFFGYAFGQAAPANASVNIVGFDDAISVSGQQYTAHPNVANFGDATTDLEGYDVTTSVNTEYKNVSVYFHKLATVSSYTPANDVNSLDDYESGYNELTVTFDAPFKESLNIANSAELPEGFTLNLPDGVTRGLIYANSGNNVLHIFLNGGKVAGDYSVEIAKNLFSFSYTDAVDGTIKNDAFSQTWTLTAATTFRVNSYAIATEDVEGNEFTATQHNLKKFQAFAVSAPAEQVFSAVTSPVTVDVTVGDADPVQVAATAALEEEGAKAVFTLPAAYTEVGAVSVSVPAGVLTLGGLTSKAFEFDVTIQPYDYFNISANPAPEITYTGDRKTIVITLPEGKTAATVGSTINLNGNTETVTAYAIEDNTVTLTLENGFQYGSNYYNIPKDFLTDTNGDKNNYFGSWSVNVVKQMMYASASVGGQTTTTNSVTVEKFSSVEIFFDEESEYSYGVPAGVTLMKGEDPITITNGWKSAYNSSTYKYGSYYFTINEISAPGTYTLHIPAGVFTSTEDNQNEEVNLNIVIPEPEYFADMTVSPADGETMESLKTITLTAPDGVTFDNVKGLQGYPTVNESRDYIYGGYEFAEDNKSVTINISERTTDGDYTVIFPDGFVRSTDGKWSPELTATYTVSYPWFTLISYNVTPAAGEVPSINGITIAAPAGIEFATPAAKVTIVVNGVDTQVGASLDSEGRIVLAYSATKADRYEISIPAETFTASDGFKKNKALTGLTYTIQPTLSINANSVDDKGNYWTTFCLNKDFTLEDGYTPYIVRDNGNGGVKLVELLGTPIVNNYDVPFTTIDEVEAATHTASTITHANIADKYEITYSMSSRDGWNSWNGFDYIDVNYSTKFYVRVLDPAYTPSEILPFIYNCGSYVDGGNYSVTQTADDSFTLEVTGQTVGGLRFEVATGTYNKPIVPANTGILVKGTVAGSVTYTPASGTKADVSDNLLWGCTKSELKTVEYYQYIYKLAWANSSYDDFGFYWGSNDGHSIQANSGKAYLILDANQSSYSNRMLIFGGQDEETTDINRFDTANDNATIYTLQGKPISGEHLPAGIYIKNGRKFIVK